VVVHTNVGKDFNMSTNTVSSHAEASPARVDLSRRAILRGAHSVAALAVAAAVPAVAFAAAEPDPIFAAIEAHRKAQAAASAHDYTGYDGELKDEAKALWHEFSELCDRACDTAEIVIKTEPTTVAGVAASLAYFAETGHEVLPDIVIADVEEHVRFGGGLIAWAARALERLAGAANA